MRLLKTSMLTLLPVLMFAPTASMQTVVTPAPTGFDNLTNGHTDQATFDANRDIFEEVENEADGLGPMFNGNACAMCHSIGATGGASAIAELRAGVTTNGVFQSHRGDSLIHTNSTDPEIAESLDDNTNTISQRISLSTLGDGFVEAIANTTLINLSNSQPAAQRGSIIFVPVNETPGTTRVGRFGHKDQQASLESFSGDAYLNEMGITNLTDGQPGFDHENTSNGRNVEHRAGQNDGNERFDKAKNADGTDKDDPEDDGDDVEAFANFMRATKAPPRGTINNAVNRGNTTFTNIGCGVCHVQNINTAAPGTRINGGHDLVSDALGNKQIHPFGDFLLHNVGTGDGIVQNGGQGTRNQVRTIPLWGLRLRNRLMHDGASASIRQAVLRHAGQATTARNTFANLGPNTLADLMAFLRSL